mmetsp:Transcript_47120/g.142680  ORF Transcript_47120/g.142680 Transcript_47120/m.142680 type:complete len:222 (+) Transcript_47120:1721-2386(+)
MLGRHHWHGVLRSTLHHHILRTLLIIHQLLVVVLLLWVLMLWVLMLWMRLLRVRLVLWRMLMIRLHVLLRGKTLRLHHPHVLLLALIRRRSHRHCRWRKMLRHNWLVSSRITGVLHRSGRCSRVHAARWRHLLIALPSPSAIPLLPIRPPLPSRIRGAVPLLLLWEILPIFFEVVRLVHGWTTLSLRNAILGCVSFPLLVNRINCFVLSCYEGVSTIGVLS